MRNAYINRWSGLILSASLLLGSTAVARNSPGRPTVINEVKHAVSMPLSEIVKIVPPPEFHGWIERKEHGSANRVTKVIHEPDRVTQDESQYLPPLAVNIGLNFDGVDGIKAGGVIPPDTNGTVGSSQLVITTNFAYEVFDKITGKKLLGPTLIHNIWHGFGKQCGTEDGGDPLVLWDRQAQRWVVEQLEYFQTFEVCVAVSQTADATGKYNLYAFEFAELPDYPKMGTWPDAYYLAVDSLGDQSGGTPCALDRTSMLAGKKAIMICFDPNPTDAVYLPSDLDSATPPPVGAPNHFVGLGNTNTTLKEYDFHVDFAHPKKSTFKGPNTITVPAYTQNCGGGGGACVPQPPAGKGNLLDANGDRLMFRNAYRNFGDHESMVFNHAVAPGGNSVAISAVRWYELRSKVVGGKFSVHQAGTLQSKKNNFWMASAAMDKAGDIALGFSADNDTTLEPSIWLTGRVPTDPLGKMEAPLVLKKGTQAQTDSNRWGDYSNMTVDPSDDCTFWYIQEYSAGGLNWQSHATSFKFTGCS